MAPIGSISTPNRFAVDIGAIMLVGGANMSASGAAGSRRWQTTFEKRDVHGIAGGVPIC
jgi:hypothetical protein